MKTRLTNMEKNKIEEMAQNLLKDFWSTHNATYAYVDIVSLARSVGFQVGESNKLPATDNGFIAISKNKKELLIGVNYYRTWEEKRFIIAHELAHYFLHYRDSELTGPLFVRHSVQKKGKNQVENDADYFAACILMPRDEFQHEYNKMLHNGHTYESIVKKLQEIFKTPQESVERRIKEISYE